MTVKTITLALIFVLTVGVIGTYVLRNSTPNVVPPIAIPQTSVPQTSAKNEATTLKSHVMVTAATPDTERTGDLAVAPSGATRVSVNYNGDPLPDDSIIVAFDGGVQGSHVRVQVSAASGGTVTSVEYTRPGPAKSVKDTSRSICNGGECAGTTIDVHTNTVHFNNQKLHQGGATPGSVNDKTTAVLDGFVEYNATPAK
jgi:hypothetical protein